MKHKKIYIFIGTSAELIKIASVIRELNRRKIKFTLITSGQTEINFDEFVNFTGPIDKVISLKRKEQKSSLLHFLFWSIKTFFVSLLTLRNEFKGINRKDVYFIVHGDTVSSLIGAFIAVVYRLNLVHVESGLRSFNYLEPFPEEICRFIISQFATIHFCPNQWSVNNLKNHTGIKIDTKQNTLLESFWMAIESRKRSKVKTIKGKYFALVLHRQEHVMFQKDWSKRMFAFIIKNSPKDLQCVFIIHDLTASFLKSTGDLKKNKRLVMMPRLPFVDFIKLMNNSEFVVSDGGSNQEELSYMGKPCLILRNSTERIEGLGENALLSHGDPKVIIDFFAHYQEYKRPRISKKFHPSKIIVDYLIHH